MRRLVLAYCRDIFAVWTESRCAECPMKRYSQDVPSAAELKYPRSLVLTGCCQVFAILTDGDLADDLLVDYTRYFFARVRFKYPGGVVIACRSHIPTVWAKDQRIDCALMLKRRDLCPATWVKYPR